jgi:hypothetical protein
LVIYQQVFWYDMDTNAVAQLTTGPTNKEDCFMFQAPEFNDTYYNRVIPASGSTPSKVRRGVLHRHVARRAFRTRCRILRGGRHAAGMLK